MFKNLSNFWKNKIGISDESNSQPAQNSRASQNQSGLYLNPAQQRQDTQSRQTLFIAMDFFTSGQRVESLPHLEQVLSHPAQNPTHRMTAYCLAAETYRGLGVFDKAEQYYELSISESEKIPIEQQSSNEFLIHYRPRAHLGLLTVYRRILHEDHNKIVSLLQDAQKDFNAFGVADLRAQLYLVEGLYLRQLGNVDDSVDRIKDGFEEIKDLTPPFLFLHPEHFEALQILSHLCQPGGKIHAARLTKAVLTNARGSWNIAIACAASLHLHFRKVAENNFLNFDSNEFGSNEVKVTELIEKLTRNAKLERDPLVLSEVYILQCVWNMLVEQSEKASVAIQFLLKNMDQVCSPLLLLRATELGALRLELSLSGLLKAVESSGIFEKGLYRLKELTPALKSYGYDDQSLDQLKNYLTGQYQSTGYLLEEWSSDSLQALRCRVWP